MLFGNKKQPAITLPKAAEPATYETALNYLIGLSNDDYAKIRRIAVIHRKADQEACKVLGVKCTPTTFITEPVDTVALADIPVDFIESPEVKINKKPKAKKGKK